MPKKSHNRAQGSAIEQEGRSDRLELEGRVDECKPGTLFIVKCGEGHQVLCTLSGKLRLNRIRILPGDQVKVEVSPYDLSRGRVIWRN